MRWVPGGLAEPLLSLARAIDAHFQPRVPVRPVRLPQIAAANLTTDLAGREPYAAAIDATNGKLVISRPDGAGGYEWVNADGTSL